MFDSSGKTALITGGTSGIGAAVAGAVVFLSWPAAAFITGVILPVDGGYLVS
jgi:NAD(P)-dependent dehydrogenase (short-subunit alcohol dehydrogenase family)